MEITTKICKHCNKEKPVSEYHKAGGGSYYQPYCKPCDSERKKKYARENKEKVSASKKRYQVENKEILAVKKREYYDNNKDEILKYHKEYGQKNKEVIGKKLKVIREKNPEFFNERAKQYRLNKIDHYLKKEKRYRENKTPEQKERTKANRKAWELRNKDVLKERYKERKRKNRRDYGNMKSATDAEWKLLKNMRNRIRISLKKGIKKSNTTQQLLGCTIPQFKIYFESLFTEGMTWGVFMNGEIHIDHIRPCSSFDLSDPEQQRACFHYKNIQPLFKLDNLRKSNTYTPNQPQNGK